MTVITDVVSYIGFLMVVIGLHEAGHYLVARRFGLVADVFSLGFGKILFARKDKSGTSWQIRALPAGGFVKLDETRLAALPPSQRMAIYAAGPAVNMALGLALVTIVGIRMGTPALKAFEISCQFVPQIVATLLGAVTHIFSGDLSTLTGPVGSAMASGDAVRLHGVMLFMALFSWSVGVLNLLPVPLLDGGQIVMAGLEMIAGKPSDNTMKYASWAGRSFIGFLIVAGFAADFVRLVG
ncbi:MAG TPA: site-2 protease family protein [Alphaproteobacteria bacterium]|jgi:regulator of sigma E protease|nr:site-2 protease family protein [Alphaproteobacteria bacterium]